MKQNIDHIVAATSDQRRSIPRCNLAKFDIETAGYLQEMENATSDAETERLAAELWERTCWLKSYDASAAPAKLRRLAKESNEDYVNRIYQAGGYYAGR